jgi:AraC-like DNA-binding protein
MPEIRSVAEIVERKAEQDILADVLRAVRLSAAIFHDNEARDPWVTATPTMQEIARALMPEHELVIPFHMVTEGSCWVELWDDPAATIHLTKGDVVILAKGDHHFLASAPGMRAETDPSGYARPAWMPKQGSVNEAAGGSPTCRFVCAFVGCDARPFNPLFDALPRMFRARTSQATQELLATLVRTALNESEQRAAGSQTMLARVAELIFLEVIREHIRELSQDSQSWLSGLKDRHVGAALRLIHGRPTEPWTLEGLARTIGISRSGLAERFSNYVGQPPMQYLARWRLQLAARLLEEEGASIAQAASDVGYESEAAFSTAFRKWVGVPPGAWRKTRLASKVAAGLQQPASI